MNDERRTEDVLEIAHAGRGPDKRSGRKGNGARARRMRRAAKRIIARRELATLMSDAQAIATTFGL